MGCQSDYLNPTHREAELQETAKNFLYALTLLGKSVPDRLIKAANDPYCSDDYVEPLCAEIKAMTQEQMDRVVYNGRSQPSRDLAKWWDRHVEADRRRIASEEREVKRKANVKTGLSKLTVEERVALGLHPTEPT